MMQSHTFNRNDSFLLPAGVFFSYETCGFQNKYDETFLTSRIAGRHMEISIADNRKSTRIYQSRAISTEKSRRWRGYEGVLIDTLDLLLQTPKPKLSFSLSDFASESSRALYPLSSYSACCLDVLVGKVDLCIGEFWITSERLAMGVDFINPFATDNMVLLARNTENLPSILDILKTPWQPFTSDLWVIIVLYMIIVSANITMLTDASNHDDFANTRLMSRWSKAVWLNSMGFVSRSIKNSLKSTPARVAALGFGFFLLVTLQSWTAALASTLVVRHVTYNIRNFQDALDCNAKICCAEAISLHMKATWPSGNYIMCADW